MITVEIIYQKKVGRLRKSWSDSLTFKKQAVSITERKRRKKYWAEGQIFRHR
jgi:hypothetical protein